MRYKVWLLMVVVLMVVATTMASAVDLVPTFLFSVRNGETDTRYLVRFVGSKSGELSPVGNTLRPLPGETVICQLLQVDAGVHMCGFSFQYACVALPQANQWQALTSDDTFGYVGELGQFAFAPGGLATPLRFRTLVRNGKSCEVRIFGFKEPIINGLMNLFGMSHKDLVEYSLLYVAPRDYERNTATAATKIDGSQFADAKATTENFRRTAEALKAVQYQVAQSIGQLNLNDAAITKALESETARNNEQDARLTRLESWAQSVAGTKVLVPTTTASAHEKFSWRLVLPAGQWGITTVVGGHESSFAGPYHGTVEIPDMVAGEVVVQLFNRQKTTDWRSFMLTASRTVKFNEMEVR
ncbi:MAG: hypothetical protein NTY30_04855 [Candidatus Berkelbacteria bacterium]|nr:hypothetical protein [Candidatus Berkelbacteria bacterium]